MTKKNKHTLLKGEGANQHTLYGDFQLDETQTDFTPVVVKENSVLRHEQPNGSFGEHKQLAVNKGDWRMGLQVEYNPFQQTISQVWD